MRTATATAGVTVTGAVILATGSWLDPTMALITTGGVWRARGVPVLLDAGRCRLLCHWCRGGLAGIWACIVVIAWSRTGPGLGHAHTGRMETPAPPTAEE